MATDPAAIQATFDYANLAFLVLSAAVFWTLPHRAAKVLAVSQTATFVLSLIGRSPFAAADPDAWGVVVGAWEVVSRSLFALVMFLYPERPASRIERALLATYVAWISFIYVFNRYAGEWVATPPPGSDFRITPKWYFLSYFNAVSGLLLFVVTILWLRRALAHKGPEARAAPFYVSISTAALAIAVSYFLYMSGGVVQDRAWSYHEWAPITGRTSGDPYGLVALLWLSANGAALFFIAYATSKRQFIPILLVGLGLIMHVLSEATAVNVFPHAFLSPVYALLFVIAITQYNLFGARDLPRWAGFALAAGFGLPIFFVTLSAALSLGDDDLILGGGIAIALALAGVAVAFVLRRVRGMSTFTSDPATTRSRIEPYHAMLVQELSSGTSTNDAFEKLRPLRARLGISDHEHALLEYASGTSKVARLTERSVQPGVTFLSRYRVLRTIKEGGMGVTHLAVDERVGRRVVLKTLRSTRGATGLADLLKEARALGRLEHPNVVNVIDADVVGDEAFLVMEYVDGGSLADRLTRGPLDRAEFERLADDLLAALDAVHAAGLVHRDVKPSNVLLTSKRVAKLADFGVAHLPGFETTAGAIPGEGAIGTVRYMSPEQARGRPAGPRSDLYSAALVLYEALTGRGYVELRPHESAIELQLRVAASAGFDRNDVPPAERAWFARALHPLASERFTTAREMREALLKTAKA